MTFGSLFSGVGGMDLGLERSGMRCVWQVEIDPFCRNVLAKHWPNVRRENDVRDFPPSSAGWECDLICGGFPCQDISNAGKKIGIDGKRSGLWSEFARIIRVLRPKFVIVENVAALLVRGIDRVLGDMASIGYDAEWSMLSACRMGAPHTRDRLFIIAYPASRNDWQLEEQSEDKKQSHSQKIRSKFRFEPARCNWWKTEPRISRLADGVPDQLDHQRGYGNAVVPQVAEYIGSRIMEATR